MKKFKYAFTGLINVLKDKSVITQVILGILAIIGGLIIKLDFYEWLIFILCIVMVISSEIFNYVIEKISDYLSEEYDDRIKVIKDASAAATLVLCIGALAICILVLIRRYI